ncbi:MAG: PBSX family phage terminase large subunit [Clostridia bacterium]|nr:PBSX family phage terminase large subunit [Bacilli bacterium]MBR3672795.1 PBSX family phage terminase large subunit [Clostridia bacterium]
MEQILSDKQKEFIRNATHRYNLKVGARRCGKTYLDNLYVIPKRIIERKGKDGLYCIFGVSKGTIERNVLQPLRQIYGKGLVGTIQSGTNIARLFGEEVYCLGCEKVNQVSKIQGTSIKYAYGDEIAKWNQEVFVMIQASLDKPYSMFDGALNPENQNHWLKKDFLDQVEEKGLDVYVQHYTIFDNPFLSKEFVDNLCKEYEGTVYYDRLILGLWKNAEGIIYRQFADNPSLYIKDNADGINFMIISIGIDYGATEGETEFKATGITPYFKQVWTLDEEKLTGLHTPEQMYEKFAEFYKRVVNTYGKVTHCFADYGALGQVLTYGMNRYLQQHGIPLQVQDCIKGRIVDRIELDCHLFGQMRRFILKKCKYLIEAYSQALWDEKHEDERLDDGTTPIDDLDASEYSIFPFYDKLMMDIKGGY